MKLQFARVARLAVALGMSLNATLGWTQGTPESPAASAPSIAEAPPDRRPIDRTRPTNAQQSMDAAIGLPEGRVTPQIRIPLGPRPVSPTRELPVRKPDATGSGTPIGESVARCEAQRGEQVRAKCRDRLARESQQRSVP